MRAAAAILAACALAAAAAAQKSVLPPEQLARVQRGLRDIYSLEHARAIENFQAMIREAPEDPAGYAYLGYAYLAQELANKQELSIDRFAASDFFSEDTRFKLNVDKAVEARLREVCGQAAAQARARLAANPQDQAALFLLGLAYQNLASFEASLKQSWWSAVRLGSQTFRHHRDLLRRDPELHDARLSVGVYQYIAGSLGWSVKWLAFLLGYRGSKQRGKQELQSAVDKALLVSDDARLVLVLIHIREKNHQAAFDHLKALLEKYPQNYLVHLDMGGLALLRNQPAEAVEIYRAVLRKQEAGDGKYRELERAAVFNRLGVAFRAQGEPAEAAGWFRKALAEANASARTSTVARLELGKTLDLLGRRDEARQYYQVVVAAEDVAGSRREAEELLRRPSRKK